MEGTDQERGEDISAFKFDNFVLHPGAGGKYFDDEEWGPTGGGGGGVVVNRQRPPRDNEHQGEGFGGGGATRLGANNEYVHDRLGSVRLRKIS